MGALGGLNVWFDIEPIAVEPLLTEIRDHIGYNPPGTRSVAVDDDYVNITLSVGRAPSHAPEDDDSEEIVYIVSLEDCLMTRSANVRIGSWNFG